MGTYGKTCGTIDGTKTSPWRITTFWNWCTLKIVGHICTTSYIENCDIPMVDLTQISTIGISMQPVWVFTCICMYVYIYIYRHNPSYGGNHGRLNQENMYIYITLNTYHFSVYNKIG